jgi:hypothetical protein
MHVWIKDIAIVLVAAADLSVVVVLVAIAATLADHRHQTSLTVVLRQKRRFVTHCKTQDQPYVSVRGRVDYTEIHDVGQKDHHGFGAACNRNDWCFSQCTWRRLHPM